MIKKVPIQPPNFAFFDSMSSLMCHLRQFFAFISHSKLYGMRNQRRWQWKKCWVKKSRRKLRVGIFFFGALKLTQNCSVLLFLLISITKSLLLFSKLFHFVFVLDGCVYPRHKNISWVKLGFAKKEMGLKKFP